MSAAQVSKERAVGDHGSASGFSEALWLAKREIRRTWLSYPASGLSMIFLGVVASPIISGVFEMEGLGAGGQRVEDFFNAFFADFIFLLAVFYLGVNAVSRDYVLGIWQGDVFSHRLIFLKSLPISARDLVNSRVMSMLFVMPFTVPAFFLPLYFLSGLRELGASYLWFCGIWIGFAVLYNGLTLLCELGLNATAYVRVSFAIVIAIVGVLLSLEATVNLSLVERTASLARDYGPLPAAASLLLGFAGLFALARLTTKRVERRELS